MSKIRSVNTKLEIAVRKVVHGLGYRYRLHVRDIPGKPDLAFRNRKKAVFVHGCFWHQHVDCNQYRQPKSNNAFWGAKLARNKARDLEVQEKLKEMGWSFLVVWECETKDVSALRRRLVAFLEE